MNRAEQCHRWASSGALELTGWPRDGSGQTQSVTGVALGPPDGFVPRAVAIAESIATRSSRLGRRVALDPLAVMTERAALRGFTRAGATSCGGWTHLVDTADGWLAVSLARPDDVDLLPAWLGASLPSDDELIGWLGAQLRSRPSSELQAAGVELGLPVGAVPRSGRPRAGLRFRRVGAAEPVESLAGVVVADLSSLWAGPLCGAVLADAGATVIKVESTARPDGTRHGPAAVFDLVNAGKRSVTLDITDPDDRSRLARLLTNVDVVIESARPRALEQMGIVAEQVLADHRPSVWASITGHGRGLGERHRVGFGDDAAVAGGLVSWSVRARVVSDTSRAPCFCLDAVADPLTGLVAARAILQRLESGGSWLIDAPLAGVAAGFVGPTLDADGHDPVPPVATRDRGRGPELGADTADVLAELGIG